MMRFPFSSCAPRRALPKAVAMSARSFFVSRGLPALVLAMVALGSRVARADEPVRPETDVNPSALPPRVAQPNLILIGAAVTAGWYGAALGSSYIWKDSDASKWLRIPVAGPYVAFAHELCAPRETNCSTVSVVVRTVLTAFSAVGQAGGVVAMLEGAFLPTSAKPADARRASETHVADSLRPASRFTVAPVPVGDRGDGVGLGIAGVF
jgi:hypothetical protein